MVLKWGERVLPLAAVALSAGCNLGGAVTPPPSTAAPATEQAHATPAVRYFNNEGKFSLVLPVGWLELGPLAMTLPETGAGYSLYVLGPALTESGGPGASMIVIADAAQLTLEQFAASQCSTCPAHPSEAVTLGTVPAVRLLIGGGTVPFEKSWFLVEHQGRRIGLAIHDLETFEPLDEVLATLRLEAD